MRARRLRVRRVAKWTGLVLCTVMGVVWVAATWFDFGGDWPGSHVRFTLAKGLAQAKWHTGPMTRQPQLADWADWERAFGIRPYVHTVGPIEWQELATTAGTQVTLTVPLWLPFFMLALPTAFLWHRDRRFRFPPGHCQTCGYNLQGLTEPRCPECGAEFGDGR